MNILHLHTSLNLTCGISKIIYLIAKYPVGNSKHFVAVLDGDAGIKFANSKINVTFLNYDRKSVAGVLKTIKKLKRYIKENDIHILHSHHRFFDMMSYIISFFCKVKRVTSVQSIVYGKKSFSYKSPLLLAAGESVKKHLIKYFGVGENRIVVFNNFVDVNEIPQNQKIYGIKEELKISGNSYVVGFTGRFSIEEKGIDILINSFGMFKKKYNDAYLLMIGSGKDIKKINNIPENVIILDSKQDIFEYYKIFDCLVLPSRVDPFPLTALESGMMKVPFIGADVDGIREIINDGEEGLLFEKDNEKMLYEKMEMFYSKRELAEKCAENLYKKVINKYSFERAVEFLNNKYEEL